MESQNARSGYPVLHLFNSKNLQTAPTKGPVAVLTARLDEARAKEDVAEDLSLAPVLGIVDGFVVGDEALTPRVKVKVAV